MLFRKERSREGLEEDSEVAGPGGFGLCLGPDYDISILCYFSRKGMEYKGVMDL